MKPKISCHALFGQFLRDSFGAGFRRGLSRNHSCTEQKHLEMRPLSCKRLGKVLGRRREARVTMFGTNSLSFFLLVPTVSAYCSPLDVRSTTGSSWAKWTGCFSRTIFALLDLQCAQRVWIDLGRTSGHHTFNGSVFSSVMIFETTGSVITRSRAEKCFYYLILPDIHYSSGSSCIYR